MALTNRVIRIYLQVNGYVPGHFGIVVVDRLRRDPDELFRTNSTETTKRKFVRTTVVCDGIVG